jgi:hypothetical protein
VTPERDPQQIPFPPLGRLAREGKRERERGMSKSRVLLGEFQIQI